MTTESGGNADVLHVPDEQRTASAEVQTPSGAWPPTRSPKHSTKPGIRKGLIPKNAVHPVQRSHSLLELHDYE